MNIDRDSAQEEGAPTNSDDAQPGDHAAVPAVPADQEPPSAVRRVSSSRYPDLTKAQIRAAQAAIRLVNESVDAQLLRQTKEALASFQTRFAQLVAEAMADLRSLSARLTASAPNAIADLSAANAALTRQSEDLNRAVRAAIEAAAAPDTRAMLESLQFSLRLDPNILRRLRELVGRLVPPNVRDLTPEEVFGLVVSAGTHRLGVLYAISPDRLAELATADMPDEEVDALLDTFGDEEFAYIVAVLDRVREAEPEGLSALLVQAIEALRAGLYAASQALSTVVWDTEVTTLDGRRPISFVKGLSEEPSSADEPLWNLLKYGVYAPLVRAYTTPNDSPFYSRNGTIHAAQAKQFTKANAVRALTIAVSLLAWHSSLGRPNQAL